MIPLIYWVGIEHFDQNTAKSSFPYCHIDFDFSRSGRLFFEQYGQFWRQFQHGAY